VTRKHDEDTLLRSVALQNANSILVARQRAEQRQEAYLAEAQKLSHTGSFGWRVSTDEIIWSEETFRIFQYDRMVKPTVDRVLQRVHPEDVALVKQTIERASQDGEDFEHEYRLMMPDNSVKHVHVVARGFSDESGGVEFVGAVMDVTERRGAEEKLRHSEAYLHEAQRLGHMGSWAHKSSSGAFFASPELVRLCGGTPDGGQPTEKMLRARIHPEDRPLFEQRVHKAWSEKTDLEHEYRFVLPDGSVKHVHSVSHPVFDESGAVVEHVGTIVDVTDRKRTEMLLAGEKRLLEMIARGDSRALILDAACRLFEKAAADSLSSILLLDPNAHSLRHGAAPSLPRAYIEAIDGIVIGPSVGSCGTAAYRAEPVIVSDIATDPLWADYRDLALAHGLRACWSTPILSSSGRVLGTFAIYHREPRSPTPQEENVIEQITHLASIAVEREQAGQALEDLAGRLIHAQEAERSRIGRELHDHISQTLGLLAIKIDRLRATAAITPDIGGALDELRRDTSDITDDVHRLSQRLHSSTLDYLGLVPALQKLVSEFSERHDIAIPFAHASVPRSLPSEVALCLFRIAEEGLTNIAKHSKARSARVHIAGTEDGIHLTVEDAGEGFDVTGTESKRGLGFVSMQERLRVLHGTIRVDSAPSRGTRIDAWVPAIILTRPRNEAPRRSERA
jgi:signal transduction histidine kinase/PAS domain-containing protein